MEVAPLPSFFPKDQELMIIEYNEEKYQLEIKREEENYITLIISKKESQNTKYFKKMNFDEIKEIHKLFGMLNSFEDFIDYIKAAFENKKLSIKIDDTKLLLVISAEYLFKPQLIEIPFTEQKNNLESDIQQLNNEILILKEKIKNLENNYNKEIKNLKEENENLKELIKSIIIKLNNENNNIKEEINNLKEIINNVNNVNNKTNITQDKKIIINSVIMKNEEFGFIEKGIEDRINKKIKEVKKLYQATVDGGEPSIFHSKCDNIPNTLTIVKTRGQRRSGGFASETWESKLFYKDDINSFLFSLDNQKIYPYINNGLALFCNGINGPSFGSSKNNIGTFSIYNNPFKNGVLFTGESFSNSYDFKGDNNALSEDGNGKGTRVEDYEVFQILF